jgi:predicted outer membrane protein
MDLCHDCFTGKTGRDKELKEFRARMSAARKKYNRALKTAWMRLPQDERDKLLSTELVRDA